MSKVKIEGNASGSGTLTIAAPNTNTDRTLSLPDSTGTLVAATGGVLPALDGSNLTNLNVSAGFTSATTVDITGSSSATFTGIPSTAKVIKLSCYNIIPNAAAVLRVKVGDSSGLYSSGYDQEAWWQYSTGTSNEYPYTTHGWFAGSWGATRFHLDLTLSLADPSSNIWVGTMICSLPGYDAIVMSTGSATLSNTLDRIGVETDTGTCTSGKVTVHYI